MSAHSFRSLTMAATCAAAALGCYLVSLRVASERASLEDVETRIVLAQRDLRVLQTEIGTRGRLSQLERWNAGAFALSAPAADQFLRGSFELARLTQPQHKVDFQAPVVLASAPAPEPHRPPIGEPGTDDSGAPTSVAAECAGSRGKLEDRDARGPGKAGRRNAFGDRNEVHGQAGYGGEAGPYASPWISRASRPPNPWQSRAEDGDCERRFGGGQTA